FPHDEDSLAVVLESWVLQDHESCMWPRDRHQSIKNLVKQRARPKENWLNYPVVVLKICCESFLHSFLSKYSTWLMLPLTFAILFQATYNKAVKAMKKAEDTSALDTTDGGGGRDSQGDRRFRRRPFSTCQARSLPVPPPDLARGVFGPRGHQIFAYISASSPLPVPPTGAAGPRHAADLHPPAATPGLTGSFESQVPKLLVEQRQQVRELDRKFQLLLEGQEELRLQLSQLARSDRELAEPAEEVELPIQTLEEFQAAEKILEESSSRKALV
ncbi:unnamed protein product, partial [Ixodes hexagonus]